MNALKSIIYLDEYKMYSLSSQVFEGVTEYLINNSAKEKEDLEEQRGPIGSGRLLANILLEKGETQEKKFLHDYAYLAFENQLIDSGKVIDINGQTIGTFNKPDAKDKFVRIRAKAIFNDIKSLKETFSSFNKLGEAFARVTNQTNLEEASKQIEVAEKTVKDRNERAKLKEKGNQFTDIKRIAKEQGLHLDDKFLDSLSFLLSYGYGDQFEIQQSLGTYTFSANLKRASLREDEALLVRKYSRITEREFSVFGIVTQGIEEEEDNQTNIEVESGQINIKRSIMNMVNQLSVLEAEFTGRNNDEIYVDPIAIYMEL